MHFLRPCYQRLLYLHRVKQFPSVIMVNPIPRLCLWLIPSKPVSISRWTVLVNCVWFQFWPNTHMPSSGGNCSVVVKNVPGRTVTFILGWCPPSPLLVWFFTIPVAQKSPGSFHCKEWDSPRAGIPWFTGVWKCHFTIDVCPRDTF